MVTPPERLQRCGKERECHNSRVLLVLVLGSATFDLLRMRNLLPALIPET
jgi:hypothetical protein